MSPLSMIVQLLLPDPPGQQPYIKRLRASTGEKENNLAHANASLFKKTNIFYLKIKKCF